VHRRDGRQDEAETILRESLVALPLLERRRHYAALAELAGDLKREEEHRDLTRRAYFLEHPFELPPAEPARADGEEADVIRTLADELLPRLTSFELETSDGGIRTFGADHAHPRLLVFWSATCGWARKEAERLQAHLAKRDHPLVMREVELLWINNDELDQRGDALATATEFGLDPGTVFFLPDDAEPRIDDLLGVTGSPRIYLVLPGGLLAFRVRGYGEEDWTPTAERILDAFEKVGNNEAKRRGTD
jgi:hypothetical protein